jgi:hypothetical protein
MRILGAELLDELRSLRTRTDDAHVAEEDIEELRELVERPGSEAAVRGSR